MRYRFKTPRRCLAAILVTSWCFSGDELASSANEPAHAANEIAAFEQHTRPLLKKYCLDCHSTEKQKGELDLERFASLGEVKRYPKTWQSVAQQLASGEMPPKDSPQPTPAEKQLLAAWVSNTLAGIARSRAHDPGPVVLRRLSNAEYTYTVRDLTGVESLDPAREFPADGAAGEGFTNTGQALVMSPSLVTKYLDAGKSVAQHAVLLPDGIRFSSGASRPDWTNELLAEIRELYSEFAVAGGGAKINIAGVAFSTNHGGRIPLERYIAAIIDEGESLSRGAKPAAVVARERKLSPKYLKGLAKLLSKGELTLDGLGDRWRKAKPADAAAIANELAEWQAVLWKFNTVGHIGKVGGAKSWQEPTALQVAAQEVRLKIPPSAEGKPVTLFLVASDAGDGTAGDFVLWKQPRLVSPGRQDLLLRDVPLVSRSLGQQRQRRFGCVAECLAAAAEMKEATGKIDVEESSRRHAVDPESLRLWLDYLGISANPAKVESHLRGKLTQVSGHAFIQGWGKTDTPLAVANCSDTAVRIPGRMAPHSVAVHPTPKLRMAAGWQSPVTDKMRITASASDAHHECGNGIAWSLEVRRGRTREQLAAGTAKGGKEIKIGPFDNVAVRPGDLVSLVIGARDANHSCDLTAVQMVLTGSGDKPQIWDLSADVSPDFLQGNPHADRLGNEAVWHFYTEPDGSVAGPTIPRDSLLAKWQAASSSEERSQIAAQLQKLLVAGPPTDGNLADKQLYEHLAAFGGPLFPAARVLEIAATERQAGAKAETQTDALSSAANTESNPVIFGRHPNGETVDAASLCVQAPGIVELSLPADLAAGCELVTTGVLEENTGREGSVQLQALFAKPAEFEARLAAPAGSRRMFPTVPVVTNDGSAAHARFSKAFELLRQWFPAALCYPQIVPVDEGVTLTLFHREDEPLMRLILDDARIAKLNRLWDELHYVSRDAITMVDAFTQLMEYASQDSRPALFEPLREPIQRRAAELRQRLVATEPRHVEACLKFAARAYRRDLSAAEQRDLRTLYEQLRKQELPHEEAIRLVLARVLVAPAFLYRAEDPPAGAAQGPVSNDELATRLSYFLWSSMPDETLRDAARRGKLRDPDELVSQARRMMCDGRIRRLAIEFGCQWLQVHSFDSLDEKSERQFPTFGGLRAAMYEESILFFTDFFQNDASVLSLLDADHTFLNEALAKHYGIADVRGPEWRRVAGQRKLGRGGILGQATTLAKQSGASRTSPILRGNWVAEVLLGDRLPRPPKDVPTLPEDEATETLTVRELTEKHTRDVRCAGCHQRIDPFGFALEGFDAIGRRRERDLGNRPIDAKSVVMDGTTIEGLDGLRDYLLTKRRSDFVRQFCRKLLGYALGRGVQLSDEPLLDEMQTTLAASEYHVSAAIESILQSRQFREIRGRDQAADADQ